AGPGGRENGRYLARNGQIARRTRSPRLRRADVEVRPDHRPGQAGKDGREQERRRAEREAPARRQQESERDRGVG
ncbi:MAG: hypothetical protein BJ554DRAFT_884, partial [Olpidium bornovanus]